MKKITVLMLHLNYGGLEKQVTTLLNNLASKYEIEIISVYDLLNGKSFYELDERINVKFLLPYGPNKKEIKEAIKSFKIFNCFKEIIKAMKILYIKYVVIGKKVKKINTDIILSSRIEFTKQIKRKDIITISQEHSYINTDKYKNKVRKSFKNVKYLVVMTNKAKSVYDEWLKDLKIRPEVIVIPNMIKENIDEKLSKLNNNQIISIGRLEEVKDFETLLIVFRKLIEKNNNLTLKIVGEGSQKEKLIKLAKEYNIEEKVIFTGKLDEIEINEELLKSDVFVSTSKSESFSLVLCEAMNYGVPCVSFDIDVGPREIIVEGETGFLIENRNVDCMVEKINHLFNDGVLRKEMGKKAYSKVQKFYPQSVIDKWEKLFM